MSFALSQSMREYIDKRVAAGSYGNTSEYIRDLIRRDQEEQAKKRLRELIEAGLASGPGRRRAQADEREVLAIARGEIDRSRPSCARGLSGGAEDSGARSSAAGRTFGNRSYSRRPPTGPQPSARMPGLEI